VYARAEAGTIGADDGSPTTGGEVDWGDRPVDGIFGLRHLTKCAEAVPRSIPSGEPTTNIAGAPGAGRVDPVSASRHS
jgi:hypothetical protein